MCIYLCFFFCIVFFVIEILKFLVVLYLHMAAQLQYGLVWLLNNPQKAMIHISIVWTFLTTTSYYTNLIIWYCGSKMKILTFEINNLYIIVNCILKLKGLSLVFLLYWCLIQNIILIFIILILHLNIRCIKTIIIISHYYITIRFSLIDF